MRPGQVGSLIVNASQRNENLTQHEQTHLIPGYARWRGASPFARGGGRSCTPSDAGGTSLDWGL